VREILLQDFLADEAAAADEDDFRFYKRRGRRKSGLFFKFGA
jgi:hypothetical protein